MPGHIMAGLGAPSARRAASRSRPPCERRSRSSTFRPAISDFASLSASERWTLPASCGRRWPPAARRRRHARVAGPAERARAAMLRDQQIALRACASPVSAPAWQRRLQLLDLHLLIGHLLLEALRHLPAVETSVRAQRARSSCFFSTASSALRIHSALLLVFLLLLQEQVLIGDRDRHLGLDLHQLVLHVENDLLDHLFRILRPGRSGRSDWRAPAWRLVPEVPYDLPSLT